MIRVCDKDCIPLNDIRIPFYIILYILMITASVMSRELEGTKVELP